MNSETGEIISEEKKLLLPKEEQKKYVPLSQETAVKLMRMNRHGRRAYYKQHKEEFKSLPSTEKSL